MATINLGRVGFVNKGTYSNTTPYKVNDVVTYNRGTYACIQANTGNLPTDIAYWQVWVENTSPSNIGEGATGTWDINITGSAAKLNNKVESIPVIANTLVERDSNGNINTNTINVSETATVDVSTKYYVETNNDGYLRPKSLANVKTEIAGDKVSKVPSTDNAIVRFNGTTGEVQNSGVTIDDAGNVGIGAVPAEKLHLYNGSASSTIIKTQNSVASCTFGNDPAGFAYAWSADAPAMYVGTGKSDGAIFLYAGGGAKARLDSNGNLLLTSGTGALGYGAGAGGQVTQLTSKSTAVTLNKPSGTVITHNESLMAGELVSFEISNNTVNRKDTVSASIDQNTINQWVYSIERIAVDTGAIIVSVKNNYTSALSDNIIINFTVMKGSNS